MKYHGQNLYQAAILVTASMGKVATGINGTKVHSVFNLPICKPGNKLYYRKPSHKELQKSIIYINVLLL